MIICNLFHVYQKYCKNKIFLVLNIEACLLFAVPLFVTLILKSTPF